MSNKKLFEKILKDNDYVILDNIINDSMSAKVKNTLEDSQFPWYLSKTLYTADAKDTSEAKKIYKDVQEYIQFVHTFYDNAGGDTKPNSPFIPVVLDILQTFMAEFLLTGVELKRCKANFQTQYLKNNEKYYNTPHVDLLESHLVFLYYVNDSDGDTVIFKEGKEYARITPKQGRILAFDGSFLHAGSHPYNSESRIVINFNLTGF